MEEKIALLSETGTRSCTPPPANPVAVYIHVCPDSCNICTEDFEEILRYYGFVILAYELLSYDQKHILISSPLSSSEYVCRI